jgi:hypothetical protein
MLFEVRHVTVSWSENSRGQGRRRHASLTLSVTSKREELHCRCGDPGSLVLCDVPSNDVDRAVSDKSTAPASPGTQLRCFFVPFAYLPA